MTSIFCPQFPWANNHLQLSLAMRHSPFQESYDVGIGHIGFTH